MAGQGIGQAKSAAFGKRHGERRERVAWVQQRHLGHAPLAAAPVAVLPVR